MRSLMLAIKAILTIAGFVLVFSSWNFIDRVRDHNARAASADYPYCYEQKATICFHMTTAERDENRLRIGMFILLVVASSIVWHQENRKKKT